MSIAATMTKTVFRRSTRVARPNRTGLRFFAGAPLDTRSLPGGITRSLMATLLEPTPDEGRGHPRRRPQSKELAPLSNLLTYMIACHRYVACACHIFHRLAEYTPG